LEKKYNFLARLAYQMFKNRTPALPLFELKEIAQKYSSSHLISVDVDAMLSDLTEARVLIDVDGNYSFAYGHFYSYFIARYYKDNFDREEGLRGEIEHMANYVSSDQYSAILMFIIYFARDSSEIVQKLVANADRIYLNEDVADLESDVAFLNKLCDPPDVDIPDEVDVGKNRQDRRELHDRIERSAAALENRNKQDIAYSENLSDADKFDLAYRYIGLLGQVIRNFPGSLPGPEKLLILKSAYLLSLRMLRALLRMLDSARSQFGQGLATAIAEHQQLGSEKIEKLVDRLILFLSRLCTLSVIAKIAGSVGVSDLEVAYREALNLVGKNNASQLINLVIKLDHSPEFPLSEIRELHKHFSHNPFADTILADFVVYRTSVIHMDRRTRQSIASLFKLPANTPLLIDPDRNKP